MLTLNGHWWLCGYQSEYYYEWIMWMEAVHSGYVIVSCQCFTGSGRCPRHVDAGWWADWFRSPTANQKPGFVCRQHSDQSASRHHVEARPDWDGCDPDVKAWGGVAVLQGMIGDCLFSLGIGQIWFGWGSGGWQRMSRWSLMPSQASVTTSDRDPWCEMMLPSCGHTRQTIIASV